MMHKKGIEGWEETLHEETADDISGYMHREEILKGLEEEFRKGLLEVRKANTREREKEKVSKKERIYREICIPKKGQNKWEEVRKLSISNTPVAVFGSILPPPEDRKDAFKINLKEDVIFFNSSNQHLITVSEKGNIKIFTISNKFHLKKVWEISNHLFAFLIRTKAVSHSVMDTLSVVLIQLYCKRIRDLEKVFQELLCFSKITKVKKAFFFNGYLCMVSSFGEMQIFDEALRDIPIEKNLKPIIKSILKEPVEKKEHVNKMVKKELTINLKPITIKVLKNKVKMIYSKKSVYEEISFTNNEQVVYSDNVLFLREKTCIHAIILE